ncbi:MAG: type II toxin-antitoxin system RelE/ParE family toxin [Acetobacter sp.]|nr:type II toxin-antitoxin system RelE/ParE family toxin [Acetobacter sp.]
MKDPIETRSFNKWLSKLNDDTQVEIIADIHEDQTLEYIRIYQETGVPPSKKIGICRKEKDCPYTGNVLEIRIKHPSAYRIYFMIKDERVVLLLGGTKNNKKEQSRDIKTAYAIAAKIATSEEELYKFKFK